MQYITVHAPATIANLCAGFDVLGMALSEPYDVMHLRKSTRFTIIHHDAFGLPTDPEQNIAGVAILSMCRHLNIEAAFELHIEKHIKPGSGLGSSAASAAGAVFALNQLLGQPLTLHELLPFAMDGEALASGSRHADNVAPCLLGGVTLIRDTEGRDVCSLPSPNLFVSVVHPQIEIKTSEARALLPQQIGLKDAVSQWGNLAAMVHAIHMHDYALLGRSMQDRLIEPYRKKLIPGYDRVMALKKIPGVIAGGISGSGPSMFIFSESAETATEITNNMSAIYTELNIDAHVYTTTPSASGVQLVQPQP